MDTDASGGDPAFRPGTEQGEWFTDMSEGEKDLEAVLQDYRNLVDGFRDKQADLRKRLDSLTESLPSGAAGPAGSSQPGPDLAQFVYAYAENQAIIFDFLRAHLDTRKSLESMAAEKASLQSELARFSEQVMILSNSAIEASEEKARLSVELETSRKEADDARQKSEGMVSQISTLEHDLNSLRADLTGRQETLEAALAEKDSLQEQIGRLTAERESDQSRVEGMEETDRNLAQARQELEETRAKIGELEGRLAEVRAEDEQLRKRVEEFESENRSSRERVEGLQAEIEKLRASTVPASDVEKVKLELRDVKSERDALLDQGKSQIEKILSLEKEIERRRSQFEETIDQKVDAEKRLQETDARLNRAEARTRELEKELDEAKSAAQSIMPESQADEPSRGEVASDSFPASDMARVEDPFRTLSETEISMFQTDPDKVQSLALSEDRANLDTETSDAPDERIEALDREPSKPGVEKDADSLVDLLDSSLGELARSKAAELPPAEAFDDDDSIFDEIFKDAFPEEPSESVEDFRAAVESDPVVPLIPERPPDPTDEDVETFSSTAASMYPRFDVDSQPTLRPADSKEGPRRSSYEFPYPEITGAGMENFSGKRILLIGGDERFLNDYQHLFGLSSAELVYFPSYSHLERNGVKRHVREADMVVVFGAAADDPGVFRLKTLAEDYGRLLIEHPSSGLVSLYHELQMANAEL
jgi:DNA repair exonuclease SbcCD ATPase subunit